MTGVAIYMEGGGPGAGARAALRGRDKLEKLTRLSRPVAEVSEESRNAARRLAAIESSER